MPTIPLYAVPLLLEHRDRVGRHDNTCSRTDSVATVERADAGDMWVSPRDRYVCATNAATASTMSVHTSSLVRPARFGTLNEWSPSSMTWI